MPSVDVSDPDHRRLTLLARAWGTSPGLAVGRLLDSFEQEPASSPSPAGDAEVPIHAVYGKHRVEALFDRMTQQVKITSGPLAGSTYRSPSGAAVAVVGLYNRSVNPNRNGWSFWSVTGTGELLVTLRRSL